MSGKHRRAVQSAAPIREMGDPAAWLEGECMAALDDLRDRFGREHGGAPSVASVGALKAPRPEGGWGKVSDIAEVAPAGSRVALRAHGEREARGLRMALVAADLLIHTSDEPGWIEVRSSPRHQRRKAEVADGWANETIERMRELRRKARRERPELDWAAGSKDSRALSEILDRHGWLRRAWPKPPRRQSADLASRRGDA